MSGPSGLGNTAPRDSNQVPALLGTSSTTGEPVTIYADPSTHRLLVDVGGSGSSLSVTDGTTTVTDVTEIDFTSGATVTDGGSGVADVAISGGSGTVTEVDTGTGLTGGPITTTGTISLDSKLAPLDTLGTAGQLIRVNASATALEYFTSSGGGVDSVSGTSNRITVDNTDPANPVVDIAATYVGQNTITTLGTVSTGTWSATDIALSKGGTGADLSAVAKGGLISGTGSGTVGLTTVGTDGQILSADAASTGGIKWIDNKVGDVVGPASATDNAIARFDGTTGKLIQNSAVTVADTTGVIAGTQGITFSGSSSGTTSFVPSATASGTITLPAATGTVALTSDIPSNVVTAASTFGTDNSILRADGTSRGAQSSSTNATIDDSGNVTAGTYNKVTVTAPASGSTLTIADGKTLTANNSLTLAGTDSTTMTFPSTSQTIAGLTSTQTLTNKRITRRLTTTNAPGATPTTNSDNVDVMNFTGLNAAITSMTTNLSGTPNDGDLLEFRFTDDGTGRAITWGASFESTTVTLPTTTVASTMLRVGFEWNATASKWDCIAKC